MDTLTVFLLCVLGMSSFLLCAAKENTGCGFLPVIISPRVTSREKGRATGLISTSYVCNHSVSIPDNFDPTLIPSTATSFTIGDCDNGTASKINANSAPFPPMPNLSWLTLCNFQFDDAAAERINALLSNLKGNLGILELRGGKLDRLKAGILAGFSKLWKFEATDVGLKSVGLDALSKLQDAGAKSSLKELRLGQNSLTQFDFSVLEPVAQTFEILEIHENSITQLTRSKPLSLPKIKHASIKANQLKTIPTEVLDSFSATSDLSIIAYDNPYCPEDSYCRCCSLAPVFGWLKVHHPVSIDLSCGPRAEAVCSDSNAPPAKCETSCTKQFFQSGDLSDVKVYDKCSGNTGFACAH